MMAETRSKTLDYLPFTIVGLQARNNYNNTQVH